ncbi:GNAT family N-acetyltransferase [Intrasporangium sp. YIM S08009]|uniref:GNAT family N-acetyltransferase n=1 Tax=Intrasporangium zincisolvens TaxID=3080018 RepID=UPI002B052691|nr:GNAT family N-acetyltransferase [Intrasporangium sp. YIM S08009]
MRPPLATCPAAHVGLDVLVEAWNRAYDGYLVDVSRDAPALADHVAAGSVDLERSLVALDGDQPVGLALLGVRPATDTTQATDAGDAGERAWVGGFGLAPSHRGRGLAVHLAEALLDVARGSGVSHVRLEVLTPNVAARRTYERVGFRIARRLLVLGGPLAPPADRNREPGKVELLEAAGWTRALGALQRLGGGSAQPWGREAAHLTPRPGDVLALAGPESAPTAVVLLRPRPAAAAASTAGRPDLSVLTGAALDDDAADAAVSALAARHPGSACRVVNEPATSPLAAAFGRAGLAVDLDQHEMTVSL